jgi:hypothetical protein
VLLLLLCFLVHQHGEVAGTLPVDPDWSDVTSKSLLLIIATLLRITDIRLA